MVKLRSRHGTPAPTTPVSPVHAPSPTLRSATPEYEVSLTTPLAHRPSTPLAADATEVALLPARWPLPARAAAETGGRTLLAPAVVSAPPKEPPTVARCTGESEPRPSTRSIPVVAYAIALMASRAVFSPAGPEVVRPPLSAMRSVRAHSPTDLCPRSGWPVIPLPSWATVSSGQLTVPHGFRFGLSPWIAVITPRPR